MPARPAVPDCDWDLIAGTGRRRSRPAARPGQRRGGLLRPLLGLPLAGAAIIGLVALAETRRDQPPIDAPFEASHVPAAPASVWAALDPATTPWRLVPEEASAIPVVAARASAVLGLREDVFGLGSFAEADTPFLRLVVTGATRDDATPPEAGESAYVGLVRRAAETDGLSVGRVTARETLATGFGPLEILDVSLAGATSRACTALRLRRKPQAPLALDGYVCGPAGSLPEAASLGCLVDRLTFRDEGPAALVAAVAAARARRPAACRSVEETASTVRPGSAGPRSITGAAPHPRTTR